MESWNVSANGGALGYVDEAGDENGGRGPVGERFGCRCRRRIYCPGKHIVARRLPRILLLPSFAGAATCRKVVEAGNKLGERALSTEVLRPRSGKKLGAEYVLVAQLR